MVAASRREEMGRSDSRQAHSHAAAGSSRSGSSEHIRLYLKEPTGAQRRSDGGMLVAAFPHMCKLIASHTPPFLRVLRSRAPSKRLRDTSNCNYGSSSSSCNCGYPCRQIAERILPLGAHVRDRQDFLADNEEQRVDGFDLRKLRRLIRVLRRSQILSLDGDKSKAIASQEALQQSIQHYSHSHSLLSNLILDESNQDRKVPTSEMRIPHAVSVDRMG